MHVFAASRCDAADPHIPPPPPPKPPRRAPNQAARLDDLQARVGVPFDGLGALHSEALQELWSLTFAGEPYPGPDAARWKDMGWQSARPERDLRAAGFLGLECLLHLARARPALYRDLRTKARGRRSEWEYPFAAAGVNVAWALVELLRLDGRGGGPAAAGAPGRGFIGLLPAHDAAFEEVFCAMFDALDRRWLARGASYMEFNAVLSEARARVARALAAQPADVEAFRAALGLAG